MAQTQRVRQSDGALTWTVCTDVGAVIVPAEEYLEFARQRQMRANTIRSYAHGLAQWWTFLEQECLRWDTIGVAELVRFTAWLQSPGRTPHGLAASSVPTRLRPVTNCYRYHADRGAPILTAVRQSDRTGTGRYAPFLGHIRQVPRTGPAFTVRRRRLTAPVLTADQVRVLLQAEALPATGGDWTGDLRYRLLWALLAETGMRIGEALLLQHRDWGQSNGTPVLTIADRPGPHGLAAKSGHRRVHIGTQLDALYSDWVWFLCDRGADEDMADWDATHVFCTLRGPNRYGPLRPENVYQHLRSVKKKTPAVPAGMTPHWLRHTHATALLLSGTPPHVVARRLGHRDVQTTLNIYGHVTDDAELQALTNWSTLAKGWEQIHD